MEVLELFRISSESPQNLQKAPRNLQEALKLFGKSFSRVSCMFFVLKDAPGALFEMDFRSPRLTILFQSASNRLRFSSESPRVILKRFWGASRSSPELVPVGEYTSLFLIIPCNSKIIKISSDYWNTVGPLRVCLSLHKSDQKMKGTSGHFFLQ